VNSDANCIKLKVSKVQQTEILFEECLSTLSIESRAINVYEYGKLTELNLDQKTRKQDETITFDQIGGLSRQIASIKQIIETPLERPELFSRLGASPPGGILLFGPPGTGKTYLLKAIANTTDAAVFTVTGPNIVSKYQGESEEKLRRVFESARLSQPSIILIDELDVLVPRRTVESSETEVRLVSTLLSLMDGVQTMGRVCVIGATNRPNYLDDASRRPGRFEREIEIGIPDRIARLEILRILFDGSPLQLDVGGLEDLALRTHAYVGADLAALHRESVLNAVDRAINQKIEADAMYIKSDDVKRAFAKIRPSAMREIFMEPPNTKWTDIGGQKQLKQALIEAVEWPLTVSSKPGLC